MASASSCASFQGEIHLRQTTMAVIDADAKYIQDVVPLMNAAATADAAKAEIKQKYPAYQSDFLLGFSAGKVTRRSVVQRLAWSSWAAS